MTAYTEKGLTIHITTNCQAATHEMLLKSLTTALRTVATHPEATAEDREAAVGLSALLLAIMPGERELAKMG